MKTIHLYKFEPLYGQKPNEVTIIIDKKLPAFEEVVGTDHIWEKLEDFYQHEAEILVEALYNVLPQGTFDRLGIEFMRKKVSLHRGKTDG